MKAFNSASVIPLAASATIPLNFGLHATGKRLLPRSVKGKDVMRQGRSHPQIGVPWARGLADCKPAPLRRTSIV